MDKKKHFYRMDTHSGGWDDLPVSLVSNVAKQTLA